MLKVLCVVDKERTALDRLAQGVKKYHGNIDYQVIAVHPKRPDQQQLDRFVSQAMTADVIDWQYYRTAEMIRQRFPETVKTAKHILTHNNPYGIKEGDWNSYDIVVGNNKEIYDSLSKITESQLEYIPLTVDTDFWTFNDQYKYSGIADSWKRNDIHVGRKLSVIMVANRIEAKKGILPVARACQRLGIRLILVGAISDHDYWRQVMDTGVVKFYEQISDEGLRDLYYEATLHVCNSVDGFESGTLPILEAMLCGVPVMTRKVGHVPELFNGENMCILSAETEDVDAIEEAIGSLFSDKKRLEALRDKAWQSAKGRSFERRAYMYQKLYREVLHPHEAPVSVVVPVFDKPEVIRKCLNAIANQTYKNIEIIVADDNPDGNREVVKDFVAYVNFPVRYIHSAMKIQFGDSPLWFSDYGLARARNLATIEATGDIMVYCDQRMIMEPDAVYNFVLRMKPKYWLYGNKGGKKDFVENFSAVYRKDVINAGMFCERMDAYGGLSQETRYRIRNQQIQTEYVEAAKATAMGKSSNRNRKRSEIIRMKNRLFKMGLDE